jgi:hypothetical protein
MSRGDGTFEVAETLGRSITGKNPVFSQDPTSDGSGKPRDPWTAVHPDDYDKTFNPTPTGSMVCYGRGLKRPKRSVLSDLTSGLVEEIRARWLGR